MDKKNQNCKTDGQKALEEMAKALCPHYADGKCYYETNEVSTCDCECEFCWAVSVFLKAGYRKIPENAVVLTGTETEECLEDLLTEFDEMSFYPATLMPNAEECAREWKRKLIYAIGQLRKEMAEKFAERLKETATKEIARTIFDEFVYYRILEDKLDEIVKEITEGKANASKTKL